MLSVSQTNGSLSRSVAFAHTGGDLTKITDAEGRFTTFGYSGHSASGRWVYRPDHPDTARGLIHLADVVARLSQCARPARR